MSTFQVADTITRSYALDANELYDYPAKNSIQPLQTCPLTSEIKEVTGNYTSGNTFTFDLKCGQTQFMANCIKYKLTIPLEITLKTADNDNITEANYMEKVLGNNADIVYSQYSIMQCIQALSLELNNQNILNLSNVGDIFSMVSPYYARSDVNEWFHSSQPDKFQNLDLYNGTTGATGINYYDEDNELVSTSIAIDNENNIFASRYKEGFCSRTPVWKFVAGVGKTGVRVTVSLWCYLPLTFAGTPDNLTSLTGIDRLQTSIVLKQDLGRHLFNMKPNSVDAYPIGNIALDLAGNAKSTMLVQLYTPPSYMKQNLFDMNGHLQGYSISIPKFTMHAAPKFNLDGGESVSFDFSSTHASVVPRAAYIGIQRIRGGSFEQCSTTPTGYAVIKNLNIKIDSASTSFNSTKALSYLADCNGYAEGDLFHRMIKGFGVKVDFSKDLSLPEDLVVGQGKSFTITVSGSCLNPSSIDSEYRLVIVLVSDATLDFTANEFRISSGVSVASSDLSNKNFLPGLYSTHQRRVNVLGGGFFSGLGKGVLNIGKKLFENRHEIAKIIGDTVGLVKTMRGGELGGQYAYSNVSGGSNHTTTLGGKKIKETLFK